MSTSTPAERRPRPYHHGALRAALLAEAVRALADGATPAALSLRELARRLGVSPAAPYRHFADKDALLAAVAQEGFQRLSEELDDAAATHPDDPLRQLTDIGWAYVHFALRQPQYFQVMFGRSATPQSTYPQLRAAGQSAFGILQRVIEGGQKARRVTPGDPRELAVAAWSQVHGLATLLLEQQLPLEDDTEREAMVRRCLHLQHAGLAR
jgi:AcrR family transcriptional regulator